jgi:hypothetical protein
MQITRPNLRSRIPSQTGLVIFEERTQVCVHDGVPLVGRHLVKHAIFGDPGIVHQDFDRIQVRLDFAQARHAGVIARDVPLVDGNAGFALELLCGLVVARVAGSHLVAFGPEPLRLLQKALCSQSNRQIEGAA